MCGRLNICASVSLHKYSSQGCVAPVVLLGITVINQSVCGLTHLEACEPRKNKANPIEFSSEFCFHA